MALMGEDPSPSLVRDGGWQLGGEKKTREDDLGLTCKEMESSCLGLAGLPATTASLLRHCLDLRAVGSLRLRSRGSGSRLSGANLNTQAGAESRLPDGFIRGSLTLHIAWSSSK